MFNQYLITIDTDWASDSIIAEVSNYLIDNGVKCTWFITHDSPEIQRLFDYKDLFEVGVHPNFMEGSTQGKTPREVMNYLLKIAPQAKSVRTHCLMQSSYLIKMIREEFNILYDASLFLPDTPNIVPHEAFYSKNIGTLRFPHFWEDACEVYQPSPCFSLSDSRYHLDGLKIFDFHPIHIVLNSFATDNYDRCKSEIDITTCSLSDIQNYISTSEGAGVFFKDLVQFIKNSSYFPGLTISELAQKWEANR